jgi:hypothetical protein
LTQGKEDSDIADVLAAVGMVKPPTSGVLENAREVLWSAVAEEMITSGARTGSAERTADEQQQTGRKRRQDSKRQTQQRRSASPGA